MNMSATPIPPELGKKYRLRNGAEVEIRHVAGLYAEGKKSCILVGQYVGKTQSYTCQEDGFYAPECGFRPHELDVVEEI